MRAGRVLHIALISLVIGLLVVIGGGLLLLQTAWFKQRLLDYAVARANTYLTADLSVGRLTGSLWSGIELHNVRLARDGRPLASVDRLAVDYSVMDLVSKGLVLERLVLDHPVIALRQDRQGWNLSRIVRKDAQEQERQGPGRPIQIGSIRITRGEVTIAPCGAPCGVDLRQQAFRVPEAITGIQGDVSFRYQPVDLGFTIRGASLQTARPSANVRQLNGEIKIVGDQLQIAHLTLRTDANDLSVTGTVAQYATAPNLKIDVAAQPLATRELAAFVPGLANLHLTSRIAAKLEGTAADLHVTLDATDPAGAVKGTVRLQPAVRSIDTKLQLSSFNLAGIFSQAPRTDLNGRLDATLRAGTWSDLKSYDGRFTVDTTASRAAGYETQRLRGRGTLSRGRLTLSAETQAYGADATVAGTVVPGFGGGALALDLHGTARGLDLRRLPASLHVPALDSAIAGRYQLRLDARHTEGSVQFDASRLEGAAVAPGAVARFATTAGQAPAYAFDGNVSNVDLTRFGRRLRIAALSDARLAGQVNGHVAVDGTGTSLAMLRLHAAAELTKSSLPMVTIPAANLSADIAHGTLRASVAGDFAGLNPAQVSNQPGMEGRVGGHLDARLQLAGLGAPITLQAVTADATVTVADSRVGQLELQSARLRGRLAQGVLSVDNLSATGPLVNLQASGRVALASDAPSNLKYHLELRDLHQAAALVGQDAAGVLVLDGQMTGTERHLQTAGTLKANALRVRSAVDMLQAEGTYGVDVPDLSWPQAVVQAKITSTLPVILGRPLKQAVLDARYTNQELGFDTTLEEAGRTLRATGNLLLHTDHSEVHLTSLALSTQNAAWKLEPDNAVVRYGGGAVELQGVHFVNGAQRIAADGVIALDDHSASNLQLRMERIDLANTAQLLLMPELQLAGTLDAEARLTGTGSQRSGSAQITVGAGTVRGFTFTGVQAGVQVSPSGARVNAAVQQTPSVAFTVDGAIPVSLFGIHAPDASQLYDVRVTASGLNLAVLETVTDQISKASGTIGVDVRVTGPVERPRATGYVAINNGAFELAQTGVQYSALNGRIALTGDSVTVEDLRVLDDDGDPLQLTGQMALNGWTPGRFQMTLLAHNFAFLKSNLGDVDADAELSMQGELNSPDIRGQIRLHSGRLEVDRILEQLKRPEPITTQQANAVTTDTSGARMGVSGSQTASASKGIALDVGIVVPNNLLIRGNNIKMPESPVGLGSVNLTVGGEFHLRKPPGQDPFLLGTVRTVRGTYDFQSRRFTIVEDGQIMFRGNRPPDPGLDITAQRDIQGILAQVHVGGTVRDPSLQLTSDPPLDPSDVLALILFNQPLNQLNEGQRVSLTERAGNMAAGMVISPIAQSLGHALDLDVFEVRGFGDQSGGPTVNIGKQVGERAFVSLEQGFGAQDVTQFMLEYQLSDLLRLKGSLAQGAGAVERTVTRRVERSGIDLVLLIRY